MQAYSLKVIGVTYVHIIHVAIGATGSCCCSIGTVYSIAGERCVIHQEACTVCRILTPVSWKKILINLN